MNQRTFSVGQAVSDGFKGLRKHPGPAIGGILLFLLVSLVLSLIPLLNILFSLFITPALSGGLAILSLHIKDGQNPRAGDIFAGFEKFGKFLAIYWLFILIMAGAAIPAVILIFLGATPHAEGFAILGAVVLFIAIIFVASKFFLAFYIGADTDLRAMECLKKSAALTKGNIGNIILFFLAAIGIAILGILCLLVGYFAAIIVLNIAQASIYRQLSGEKEIQQTQPALNV